jgi:hypothetical protein
MMVIHGVPLTRYECPLQAGMRLQERLLAACHKAGKVGESSATGSLFMIAVACRSELI